MKEQQNIFDFSSSPEKTQKKQNGIKGSHLNNNNNNVRTTKNRNNKTVKVSNGIGSISEGGIFCFVSIKDDLSISLPPHI